MWAGIAPNLPDSATFGDFTIGNSQFSKIGTDAISTYGQWKIIQTDHAPGPEQGHLLHFLTGAAAEIKDDLVLDFVSIPGSKIRSLLLPS